ncbi:hypothetical protein K435DRAFT_959579 [Dendrothele bispora CBS 962.96]|uniref:DUF6533 domain-containing protein n=1 Tax=Dendrothele bispora (strain CBS 962.96) TaxID=1314807 RepID=A0A4V4HIQ8_DENBC|nr:hypothetical protein K435DRAFT_959579 [Dendrothele bispora CBS 962.96]
MADDYDTASHFIYITQVYFCAMYAVVIWDWLISLPREYRFIWKTHWTPVKIAYLFCRYWVIFVVPYLLYAFVGDHTRETCEKIFKIPVALAMWNQVGSESVLLIRTYAFFNRNIHVLVFLIACISGVVAYQLYVDTSQMLLLPYVKEPSGVGPCFPMSKPHSAHLLGFFIAPLLFDTVVTLMTIVRAFDIRRWNGGGPSSRLIQTFLREGVFYYILISIANLINGIFYLQPHQEISAINIPLSVMLAPVLACRLVGLIVFQARLTLKQALQILDLRERGSDTVTYSEGTFAAKSVTQNSPLTPPQNRGKSQFGVYGNRYGRPTDSNIVLSTLGSMTDPMYTLEHDISELEEIRKGLGGELSTLSTAVGGVDGEPIDSTEDDPYIDRGSPAFRSPSRRVLEMGFRPTRTPSLSGRAIRVQVEQATSTM